MLGSIRGPFGVDSGSIWGPFGVDLRSVWGRVGVVLRSVGGRVGVALESVWACLSSGSFFVYLGTFLCSRSPLGKAVSFVQLLQG